jgi:hypothetical protein
MSVVAVVVIDCTEIGASPPTATLPTMICLVLRRGVRTGGVLGSPRFIAGTLDNYFLLSSDVSSLNAKLVLGAKDLDVKRVDDIANDKNDAKQKQ